MLANRLLVDQLDNYYVKTTSTQLLPDIKCRRRSG